MRQLNLFRNKKNFLCHIFLILTFNTLVQSCRFSSHESELDSIFGPDDRVTIPKTYNYIGELGKGCTAFAVAPRLIMTAAHCTFGDKDLSWTAHGTNEAFATTLLARGMASSSSSRNGKLYGAEIQNDWAILKLDRSTTKLLQVSSNAKLNDKIAVIGYSYDISGATGHNNCQIRDFRHNTISHDCDLQGGASGGPIMRKEGKIWTVIGIQSSEYCENSECRNTEWSLRNANKGSYLTPEIVSNIYKFIEIYE